MGYETKYYIVDKAESCKSIYSDGAIWCKPIASFDLCKCYQVSEKTRRYPATNMFFFADGVKETEINKDAYNEPLKEIPLDDMIEIIKYAAENDDYRRFAPMLAMLESFKANKKQWGEIVVLHYGY